jgi:hypothetical protein
MPPALELRSIPKSFGPILLRTLRVAAIAAPFAAAMAYVVVYGTEAKFRLDCGESGRLVVFDPLFPAAVWSVLALCQVVGFRSRAGFWDAGRVLVVVISACAIAACFADFMLLAAPQDCGELDAYDYSDNYLTTGLSLVVLGIPAAGISLLAVGSALTARWLNKRSKDTA